MLPIEITPQPRTERAMKQYGSRNRSAEGTKRLRMLLKATIRAKILALRSHHLIVGYPLDESDVDFWPAHALPEDDGDNYYDYSDAMYTSYFVSRGLAIILRRDTMDLILFQFTGTQVQNELNKNAHFSGIDAQNVHETWQLITSATNILDDKLTVKKKLPTFQKLFDIVAAYPIDSRCPLNRSAIENAMYPVLEDADADDGGNHTDVNEYESEGGCDNNDGTNADNHDSDDNCDDNSINDDQRFFAESGTVSHRSDADENAEEDDASEFGLEADVDESRMSPLYDLRFTPSYDHQNYSDHPPKRLRHSRISDLPS